MNREFEEEIGSSIKFTDDADHCFSFIDFLKPTEIRMISVFCRLTSDIEMFNSILKNFHSGTICIILSTSFEELSRSRLLVD